MSFLSLDAQLQFSLVFLIYLTYLFSAFFIYHILETDLAASRENPIGENRNNLVDQNVNEITNLHMPASNSSD